MRLSILLLISILSGAISFPLHSQKLIKILAIGNSFSEDAVENYLYHLANADGVNLVIGNMYIGGCSLETHAINAGENKSAYSYRKIIDGKKVVTENVSLLNAIKDEDWDFITFQQVSQNSGLLNTFFPYLSSLKKYVEMNVTNPKVKFALHQTWAYESNSTHEGFANYSNDQLQMYNAIVNAINGAAKYEGIETIIPSGTAIQNGRNSLVEKSFTRDGYHLSLDIGRYTAACTWYQMLINKSVVGNRFVPNGLSDEEIDIAQKSAQSAVLNPNSITTSIEFNLNTFFYQNLVLSLNR